MTTRMRVRVRGLTKLQRTMAENVRRAPGRVAHALHKEALAVFRASQRLVPYDTGLLKSSGVVPAPVLLSSGRVMQVVLYTAPYAVFVHEIVKNYKSGQAYYLRQPMRDSVGGLTDRIGARMARMRGSQDGIFSVRPTKGPTPRGIGRENRRRQKTQKRPTNRPRARGQRGRPSR